MSQTGKQKNRGADNTVFRMIPIELTLTQEQLIAYEARLTNQIRLELNSESNLTVRYDAALIGFIQVLSQLHQLGIKVCDSRWFPIKTAGMTLLILMWLARSMHVLSRAAIEFREYRYIHDHLIR